MRLMLGRPQESVWLIHCCFQRRGDQGFFRDSLSSDIEKDAHSLGSWQFQFAQGRACVTADNIQMHTGGRNAGYLLILHCMCVTGDCRGQTLNESMPESIQTAFNLPEMQSPLCLSSGLLLDEI